MRRSALNICGFIILMISLSTVALGVLVSVSLQSSQTATLTDEGVEGVKLDLPSYDSSTSVRVSSGSVLRYNAPSNADIPAGILQVGNTQRYQ